MLHKREWNYCQTRILEAYAAYGQLWLMCSCCYGYQRENTFRWNSSYLHADVLLNAYQGLWRLLKGWMWPLPYRKATCFIHFDAFGVSSSMNLVGTMSLACLDHVPVLSLTHSINALLSGRWWQWRLLPGIGPPPSTCRPGTMKWEISPSRTLRSATPTAPSNAPAQFVLTIPR